MEDVVVMMAEEGVRLRLEALRRVVQGSICKWADERRTWALLKWVGNVQVVKYWRSSNKLQGSDAGLAIACGTIGTDDFLNQLGDLEAKLNGTDLNGPGNGGRRKARRPR